MKHPKSPKSNYVVWEFEEGVDSVRGVAAIVVFFVVIVCSIVHGMQ